MHEPNLRNDVASDQEAFEKVYFCFAECTLYHTYLSSEWQANVAVQFAIIIRIANLQLVPEIHREEADGADEDV